MTHIVEHKNSKPFEFDMPCLSGYKFYSNGVVRSRLTNRPIRMNRPDKEPYYNLIVDNEKTQYVSRKEVVQYGKHLQQQQLIHNLVGISMELQPVIYRPVFVRIQNLHRPLK